MFFTQIDFLFYFLPVSLLLFYLGNNRCWRQIVLLACSIFFYISGDISLNTFKLKYLCVLLGDIIWVYIITKSKRFAGNFYLLLLAMLLPLSLLLYYKYGLFFYKSIASLNPDLNNRFNLFNNQNIPLGISFFTFQIIAFAIDRFRSLIPAQPRMLDFAVFISFFPQLLSGPISRFSQMKDRLTHIERFLPDCNDITDALVFITKGLAFKVLLADNLGIYLKPMINNPHQLCTASCIYVVLAYSFQIYFDFYGYSLIAIGLGRLFGFQLPDNFSHPYASPNPREFWRRWHMTLSFWIRDYIYIPLGGSIRYKRNILIAFCLCGLWHGAGWNFIIWGFYHAFLIIAYSRTKNRWDALPYTAQIIGNFLLVSLGWMLFVFDIPELVIFLKRMLTINSSMFLMPTVKEWSLIILAGLVCFLHNKTLFFLKYLRQETIQTAKGILFAVLLFLTLLFLNQSQTFIYIRF